MSFMALRLERSKNLAAVGNVQRSLEYDCGPLNLLGNDRRRLLFSGGVGSKKLNLFLLSDMIILAKGPTVTGMFKATGPRIDLTDKAFVMKTDTNDRRILHLGNREVQFKTNEELRVWHSRISEALMEILASAVFGTPLGAGRNGKGVPPIVMECVKYLSNPDIMSVKGIFRLSGTKNNIDRLRAAFDKGIDPKLYDHNISPHDVATLLKQYFRELPNSVVPQALFSRMIELGNALEDAVTPALIENLRDIFGGTTTLPSAHIDTLRYVLEFLRALASFSPVNLMTSRNISIVFAPNLIRPSVETMETTLAQPALNSVLEVLIDHYEDVFPDAPFVSSPFPTFAAPVSPDTVASSSSTTTVGAVASS
jgi:hypothetical protein